MQTIGLDVHKRVIEAAILDSDGQITKRERFPATREALLEFASLHLTKGDQLVLEATTNTWAIARLLAVSVGKLVVSNPLLTRAIAHSKVKTDKVDSLVLAKLLHAGYLPEVWVPDESTRELRELTGRRAALVAQRTAIKNRIHAVLHQRLLHPPADELFGSSGRRFLEALALDAIGREILDTELRLLDCVQLEIARFDGRMSETAYPDPRVRLLMTLPGVDVTVALTLLAALGDVSRFPSPDHATSYLGLVPSTRQSAEHCYHGPITKRGRSHARWMLVQAAQHLRTHPGPLGHFFRKLAHKKGHNVAVVATARKLVVIAWHLLSKGEPYRYALPRTTQSKLARLRVRATGQRRAAASSRGMPRSPAHGTGPATRAVPAIDRVYREEGLPAIGVPPPGEIKMIECAGLTGFTNDIRTEKRLPRRGAGRPARPLQEPSIESGQLTQS